MRILFPLVRPRAISFLVKLSTNSFAIILFNSTFQLFKNGKSAIGVTMYLISYATYHAYVKYNKND